MRPICSRLTIARLLALPLLVGCDDGSLLGGNTDARPVDDGAAGSRSDGARADLADVGLGPPDAAMANDGAVDVIGDGAADGPGADGPDADGSVSTGKCGPGSSPAEVRGRHYGPIAAPVVPAGAVTIQPGAAIQQAIAKHPPGTTFVIATGVHRQQTIEPRDGDVLIGEAGAVLNGAKVVDNFTFDGTHWVASGQIQQGEVFDKCRADRPACKFPEQLFIDDALLEQVVDKSKLVAGRWFFDYAADKIFIADDPTGKAVEASVTRNAIVAGDNVTIRNLTIEKYATIGKNHPHGITVRCEKSCTVEDCAIRYNGGVGISVKDSSEVRGNAIHHQGRGGVNTNGSVGVLFAFNEIAHNNTKGYDHDWDAGASKFCCGAKDLVLRANWVHDNDGNGLWSDGGNLNVIYECNVAEGNHEGIFHEISFSATIRHNLVADNRASGIFVSNSSDVEVHDNLVRNNERGIFSRNVCRGSASLIAQNIDVHHNTVYQQGPGGTGASWPQKKAAGHAVSVLATCQAGEMPHANNCCAYQQESKAAYYQKNIQYRANAYRLTHGSAMFLWQAGPLDVAGWKSAGHDVGGSFTIGPW